MGRKYKQAKIYKVRDEIEALDKKKGVLDWYDQDDKEQRYRINRLIKHKQQLMADLFDEIDATNTREIAAKFRQRLKAMVQ